METQNRETPKKGFLQGKAFGTAVEDVAAAMDTLRGRWKVACATYTPCCLSTTHCMCVVRALNHKNQCRLLALPYKRQNTTPRHSTSQDNVHTVCGYVDPVRYLILEANFGASPNKISIAVLCRTRRPRHSRYLHTCTTRCSATQPAAMGRSCQTCDSSRMRCTQDYKACHYLVRTYGHLSVRNFGGHHTPPGKKMGGRKTQRTPNPACARGKKKLIDQPEPFRGGKQSEKTMPAPEAGQEYRYYSLARTVFCHQRKRHSGFLRFVSRIYCCSTGIGFREIIEFDMYNADNNPPPKKKSMRTITMFERSE